MTVIVVGQLLFLLYLLASYGRATLAGDVAAWSRFSAHGWVAGDPAGNVAMAAHLLLAAVVLCAGSLQLWPLVRRRWPALHRWSGRLYLSGCFVAAVSGLWLVWGRGTVGDTAQHVAISINAVLLAACAVMAWRTARARAFARHRAWALRTYLAAGGVFYFRVLLSLWLLVFRGPVGFDANTFSGPFLTTLAFGVYVVGPLALFELYRRWSTRAQGAVTPVATIYALAVVSAAGVVATVVVLWAPKLR